jgi:peptidoglycan/LPS O-acetylase OafA/YrhL
MPNTHLDTASPPPFPLQYRPDIDGLRAVAVLAVVFFHAFPTVLPGGFVGVDLFFVISGYLITGLLAADLQAGHYSVARFYARRIRRIFPALAVVLLATYAIGWLCLYGDEYKALGKHIVSAVGFIANWTFWTEAGYFDRASDTKPLLHLWSLGVEEQFYIVWPLLLGLAFKFGRVRTCCVTIALVSFLLNLWLIHFHPSAAFFWPFSRFWELLVGAALAMRWRGWRGQRDRLQAGTRSVLSGLGVLLCLGSCVGMTAQLAFPGGWAVLPVLGAAALIAAGPDAWINRWLSRPAVVWVGKISYALYLWHWPLLSFATIIAGGTLSASVRAEIVAISIVLAWLTTVAIERPIRFGVPHPAKLIGPCVLMLLAGYLGGMTYDREGLGFRKGYSADADVTTATLGAGREFTVPTCGVSSADQHLFQFCSTDKRAVSHFAVWGDSKADALYWGLVRTSPPGQSWTLIARASCVPLVGAERASSYAGDDPRNCRAANQVALRVLLANPSLTTVLLTVASRDLVGPEYVDADGSASSTAAVDGFDHAIDALQRAGKRVVVVLDNPELPDPRLCMDRKPLAWPWVRHLLGVGDVGAAERCAMPYTTYLARTATYRDLMDQVKQRHPGLFVYDLAPVLCDIPHNVCPMTLDSHYLYSYADHLSDYANGRVAARLLPLLTH